jgi:hypothetical protein
MFPPEMSAGTLRQADGHVNEKTALSGGFSI